MIVEKAALGNVTTYTYDLNGNLVSMTDALGQTVSLEYDKNGNATAAIQKNGGVIATGYDKSGRIISETDANQSTTKYRYDKNGQVTQITDAMGQKATFEYDALGNITKITAPSKAVTLYEYDAAGRALSSTDAEGCVTLYGYNENGQIATLTVNGNATAYEYDLAGNITAVTDAEGRRVEFGYDLSGNLVQITYPDGTAETTEYDLLGRVVRITPRTGLTTAYTYDSLGNVTSVAQGQQVTRYEYDLLGRLTKVITPDGAETAYAYDALGNIISETDPLGNTTQFAYNPENLLAQVTYANGATQRLDYDLAGNVTAETDGEGYTKHYKYDKVNRLTAVVDEAGNTTSYKYDALDNIAQVTDAMKHVTKYTYDKNGNLLTETDALGNTVTYAYTPEGWLSSVTKADGTVMTFAYDKTGNLTAQNVGEGQSIQNSYNEIDQVTTVKNSEGTITYQYNQQGYLVSVTNANGDVVSYAYDLYGNKTSMTYPDGRTVRYTYDSMNRMTSVTGLDGEVTTYAYDAAGRRVETASRTLTTEYRYDVVGSLVEQSTTGSSNISFRYSYNMNGYITGEIRTENGSAVESLYTYDPLGELTGFTQSTGYGEQYAYDKAGNMTAKTITGTDGQTVTLKMTYNKGNQLVSMTNGKDKLTYGYDKNGSMVQKTLTSKQYGKLADTYAYNSLDQLVSCTGYDGYQQRFAYDANGMRLSKSEYGNSNRSTLEELLRGDIAGLPEIVAPDVAATSTDETAIPAEYEWATTEYLYDITQEYYQVIEQTTTKDNTTTTTAYAYGVERIAAYDTNATTQYIYDGRGSVAQTISAPVADTSVSAALPQVEMQSYAYTAFGEQMGNKTSGFAYNAEDYDVGTGMINLRMRQYEPTVGRFMQKDIHPEYLLISLSTNKYLFTFNSPTNYFDANGLSASLLRMNSSSIGNILIGTALSTVHFVTTLMTNWNLLENIVSNIKSVAKAVSTILNNFASQVKVFLDDPLYQDMIKTAQDELNALSQSDPEYGVKAANIFFGLCTKIYEQRSYEKFMLNTYGFEQKEARILQKIRINLATNLPSVEESHIDFLFARMIGRLVYGDADSTIVDQFMWDATVMTEHTSEKEKFLILAGLSPEEYRFIRYKVRIQNQILAAPTELDYDKFGAYPQKLKEYKEAMEVVLGRELTDNEFERLWRVQYENMIGTTDYAHYYITSAAIMTTEYTKYFVYAKHFDAWLRWAANIRCGWSDEMREDMAGWLGDATLRTNKGNVSFTQDDYKADLDAENVMYIAQSNDISPREAEEQYFIRLANGESRATIFLSHTPIDKVIYTICKKLGIKDPDQNWEKLSEVAPDAYCFILNLINGNNEWEDYE